MGLNNLPAPLYIIFTVIAVLIIAFFSLKGIYRREPLIYTIFGIFMIAAGLFAAMQKTLYYYFGLPAVLFANLSIVFFILGLLLGFIGVFKYGNEKKKRNAKLFLAYLAGVALFVAIILQKS